MGIELYLYLQGSQKILKNVRCITKQTLSATSGANAYNKRVILVDCNPVYFGKRNFWAKNFFNMYSGNGNAVFETFAASSVRRFYKKWLLHCVMGHSHWSEYKYYIQAVDRQCSKSFQIFNRCTPTAWLMTILR